MPEIIRKDNKESGKRSRGKGKIIVLCVVGALILTAAAAVIANLSVLRLVYSPDNIVISGREKTLAVLKQLESSGNIKRLEVSRGGSSNASSGSVGALNRGGELSGNGGENGADSSGSSALNIGSGESSGKGAEYDSFSNARDSGVAWGGIGGGRNDADASGTDRVSFSNANESVIISGEYDNDRVRRISGRIDTGRVKVTTIEEGKELARVMLSPYLGDAEITALLLRHSPAIISSVGKGSINTSFNIGNNYQVTVTGSTDSRIDFTIRVK